VSSVRRRGRAAEDDEGATANNRFMVECWALISTEKPATTAGGGGGCGASEDAEERRLCSHARCGRPETRQHEFQRCSVCGSTNYCLRACQALDWKGAHRGQCGAAAATAARWLAHD